MNTKTMEVRAIARELLDERYFKRLRARLLDGEAPPQIERLLFEYAWGRPKEVVSFESDGKISVEMFRLAAGLDDDDDDNDDRDDDVPPPKKPKPPRVQAKSATTKKKKKKRVLAR